jgi:hypothetical protein
MTMLSLAGRCSLKAQIECGGGRQGQQEAWMQVKGI